MEFIKVKLLVNKCFLIIIIMFFIYMALPADLNAQNVAITDDDGYTVDPAAMLDVKSLNKGFLVPRVELVSTTDPISGTKPEGLLVWNIYTKGDYPDPGFYYWSGTDWEKVGSSALDFQNGLTKTGNIVSHEDLSSQSSVNNSGGTVIQDLTLGSLGHVAGLVSYNLDNRYYTESEVNTLITGENIWDRSSSKIYPHTISDDVGIGTSNPLHRLHILEDVNITDGTDGNFLDIQNSSNSQYVISGIRFQNGTSVNSFKGGIFYKDRLNWGRGDIIFANNHVSAGGNVTVGDARMIIKNEGQVEILGNPLAAVDDPLLEVKNKNGDVVFGVYNEGVRVNVADSPGSGKGTKGGFAVGGYSAGKGFTDEYLRVTPDSVRIYVNNESGSKGTKGGFAVGGFSANKGYEDAINFMDLTPENYFIGHESGNKTTPTPTGDGKYNSFFGYQSGKENTVGSKNLFMGYQSGYKNIYGANNVFLGIKAGYENTGTVDSDYLGCHNVFIGYLSGQYNTEGQSNVFIGKQCGWRNNVGRYNVFVGQNTAIHNTGGNFNTFIGSQSGEQNTNGSNNVFIGYGAGGQNEEGSNLLFIDNSNTTEPLIYGSFAYGQEEVIINGDLYHTGSFGQASDIKFKRNIEPLSHVLNKLKLINGVYFDWRKDEYPEMVFNKGRQIGVIAQELEKVFPELVRTTSKGYKTVDYTKITAVLVEAVKEQQKIITQLEHKVKRIDKLEQQIQELRSLVNSK